LIDRDTKFRLYHKACEGKDFTKVWAAQRALVISSDKFLNIPNSKAVGVTSTPNLINKPDIELPGVKQGATNAATSMQKQHKKQQFKAVWVCSVMFKIC